MSLSEEFVKLL